MKKNIIIVGVGKRSRNDILPALELSGKFNIIGVYARTGRSIEVSGVQYTVEPLSNLTKEKIQEADWMYVGVSIRTLAAVLKYISSLPTQHLKVLIDTPVFPWRYMWLRWYFRYFSRVVVAEDVIYLPWIKPLKEVLPTFSEITFDRSVYAYHGIALVKILVNSYHFRSVKMSRENGSNIIQLTSPEGTRVRIIEPRDYSKGTMHFQGAAGEVNDAGPHTDMSMYPIISGELCTGLYIAGKHVSFSDRESRLIGPVSKDSTITSLTPELKRIGMLTMFTGLAKEDTGWSVSYALSDVRLYELVIHLGKFINVTWFV